MMMFDGFLVVRSEDNAYSVRDSEGRVLGHVVAVLMPQTNGTAIRMFRAFGDNFADLGSAVGEFTKVRWARPYGVAGELQP
jgi:hypothetical protein